MKTFALLFAFAAWPAWPQAAGNLFADPFVAVTSGLPQCPVPRGPFITPEQARVQQHVRSQHGNSCHREGRCRLPNSYLYDAEIIPRVRTFIRFDDRFADTSVWILGERRIVTVMGCVSNKEQAEALERAIARVDDVVNVVPLLLVGTTGPPPYRVAGDTVPD